MKLKLITVIAVLFLSCNNDKKTTELHEQAPSEWHGQVSKLKSDVLLEATTQRSFSQPDQKDNFSLTISGKTLLRGIAVLKITDHKGQEVHCETFPAINLIQTDYKTANSAIKEKHLKEVIEGLSVDEFFIEQHKEPFLAGL